MAPSNRFLMILALAGVSSTCGCATPLPGKMGQSLPPGGAHASARPVASAVLTRLTAGDSAGHEQVPEGVQPPAGTNLTLARQWELEGKTEEAKAVYESLIAANPRHATAHHRLGILHAKNGDYALAEEHLLAAVDLAPENADLLNDLGFCKQLQGSTEDAATAYRAALAVDASHRTAKNNLTALANAPTRISDLGAEPRRLDRTAGSRVVQASQQQDVHQKQVASKLVWKFADEPSSSPDKTTEQAETVTAAPTPKSAAKPDAESTPAKRTASATKDLRPDSIPTTIPSSSSPSREDAPLIRFVEMDESPAKACAPSGTTQPALIGAVEDASSPTATADKDTAIRAKPAIVKPVPAKTASPPPVTSPVVGAPAPEPRTVVSPRSALRVHRDDEPNHLLPPPNSAAPAHRPPAIPTSAATMPRNAEHAAHSSRPALSASPPARRTLFDVFSQMNVSERPEPHRPGDDHARTASASQTHVNSQTRSTAPANTPRVSRRNEGLLGRILER